MESKQVEHYIDVGSKGETIPQVSSENENTTAPSQEYSIAKNRPRREAKLPKMYVDVDLVAYALSVVEDNDAYLDLLSYLEGS
ncbi:hypothetical protein V6N12_031503 [Hibiscus sabdariffa]|uniref:Uncharacterized protein n=1 Tax=Hibiscus sabdariffa TaxID=183260 RepID=A0ABR2CPF7_9ROSI